VGVGDDLAVGLQEPLDLVGHRHGPRESGLRRSQGVRGIEADLETELGPEQFTQLRQLLVQLNATDTIRNHKPRPVA
jgi:hypothetical protein